MILERDLKIKRGARGSCPGFLRTRHPLLAFSLRIAFLTFYLLAQKSSAFALQGASHEDQKYCNKRYVEWPKVADEYGETRATRDLVSQNNFDRKKSNSEGEGILSGHAKATSGHGISKSVKHFSK